MARGGVSEKRGGAFQLQEYQTDVGRCRFDINLGQCSRPRMAETSALVTETLV